MRILRLHHAQVTIPPGAEEAARSFYCGVLGLRELPKPAGLDPRGFWLAVGDGELHVGVEEGPSRASSKAHVALEVNDLTAFRERLEAAGHATREQPPIPGLVRVDLRDPFGNRLELLERAG